MRVEGRPLVEAFVAYFFSGMDAEVSAYAAK
jgi:hypothetical protein